MHLKKLSGSPEGYHPSAFPRSARSLRKTSTLLSSILKNLRAVFSRGVIFPATFGSVTWLVLSKAKSLLVPSVLAWGPFARLFAAPISCSNSSDTADCASVSVR